MRLKLAFILVVIFLGLPPSTVGAHPTGGYGWIVLDDDFYLNYDHKSQSATSGNIDWPLNLVWFDSANRSQVKSIANSIYGSEGLGQYMLMQLSEWGGSSPAWDTDWGRKRFNCYGPGDSTYNSWTEHARMYTWGYTEFSWSPQYGSYVVGTSHLDYRDGPGAVFGQCPNTSHGWDEIGEDWFVYTYSTFGYDVWSDCCNAYNGNYPHGDVIGGVNHHRDGNGHFSIIRIN